MSSLKSSPLHCRLVTKLSICCGSVCCMVNFIQLSCCGLHQTTFIVVPRSRATSGMVQDSRLLVRVCRPIREDSDRTSHRNYHSCHSAWRWCLVTEGHAGKHHSPESSNCVGFQSAQYLLLVVINHEGITPLISTSDSKDRQINCYLYIKCVVSYDVECVASLVSGTDDVLF